MRPIDSLASTFHTLSRILPQRSSYPAWLSPARGFFVQDGPRTNMKRTFQSKYNCVKQELWQGRMQIGGTTNFTGNMLQKQQHFRMEHKSGKQRWKTGKQAGIISTLTPTPHYVHIISL